MGGDHKCPVCEATFTRPQHVARHMRSHTGDKPYKCQYCGDQFARSDLLSRHVNKGHANEKPLPSIGPRKKGSVSASRATTSKQVCDQCVQANSSCDGSNPCAKCIQRRYRCTFVKFHRQTAPVGPGHVCTGAKSSPPTIPSSSRVPVFHHPPSEDEFLAPTGVPTMADALYGATPYTFPPLYPTNDLTGDNTDHEGKYRAQAHAELFASTRSSVPAPSSTIVSPNLYDPRLPSSWLDWDPSDLYQQQQGHPDLLSSNSAHPPLSLSISSMNEKDMQAELARRRHHHHQQQQPSNSNPNLYSLSAPQSHLHHHHNLPQQQQFTIISDLGQPEFFSAFGLLSLDDPNVIAGIATDGTPFFDHPQNQVHNHQTRTNGRENGSTISSSKEKESKELKELWKQYMRLPLLSTSTLNSGTGDGQGATAAGGTYLRRTTSREMPAGMGMDNNNSEDLRSYGAAVMARKAPTTLNLKIRRPMRGGGEGEGEGTDSSAELRDEGSANMERPSCKRLPSQTLGPDYAKRPFYGFVEDRVGSGWGMVDDEDDDGLVGGGEERKMRRRRMSEPSRRRSLIGGHCGGGGNGFASDRE